MARCQRQRLPHGQPLRADGARIRVRAGQPCTRAHVELVPLQIRGPRHWRGDGHKTQQLQLESEAVLKHPHSKVDTPY